ncbi:hypothetical protein L1887_14748 [Cichorium endivia]|nr:hypothetical protein L1887_14748 [Cichorium endivia]
MTLLCGLLALPPSNGVLPQSPMHTKTLAALEKQFIRKKLVASAKESIKQKASNSEIYNNMETVFIQIDSSLMKLDHPPICRMNWDNMQTISSNI